MTARTLVTHIYMKMSEYGVFLSLQFGHLWSIPNHHPALPLHSSFSCCSCCITGWRNMLWGWCYLTSSMQASSQTPMIVANVPVIDERDWEDPSHPQSCQHGQFCFLYSQYWVAVALSEIQLVGSRTIKHPMNAIMVCHLGGFRVFFSQINWNQGYTPDPMLRFWPYFGCLVSPRQCKYFFLL